MSAGEEEEEEIRELVLPLRRKPLLERLERVFVGCPPEGDAIDFFLVDRAPVSVAYLDLLMKQARKGLIELPHAQDTTLETLVFEWRGLSRARWGALLKRMLQVPERFIA